MGRRYSVKSLFSGLLPLVNLNTSTSLHLSQSILDRFNKLRLGSWIVLAWIDEVFSCVWPPALFHKLISVCFPPYLSFLTAALLWFIEITKLAPFKSAEVLHMNSLLALFFLSFLI